MELLIILLDRILSYVDEFAEWGFLPVGITVIICFIFILELLVLFLDSFVEMR